MNDPALTASTGSAGNLNRCGKLGKISGKILGAAALTVVSTMPPVSSIVVFVNPRSKANRLDPGIARHLASILGTGGHVIAARSLDELALRAREVAAARPTAIGIHGGDGTLHKTLSALIEAWGTAPLPPLAILGGGTMNVVSASLGIRANAETLLEQIVADTRAGTPCATVVRHCLKVGNAFGFVFGNGLMANFLEAYYCKPGYGPRRALWILARAFFSALVGGAYARRIFRRFSGRVTIDGKPLPWQDLTGVGAATVREVGLGFKLNHRADDDPQRMGVLAIFGDAVGLAWDLLPVQRGRGVSPKRAFSDVASQLVIEPAQENTVYTIDGDLYHATGKIEIRLGPELRFIRPR